MAITTVLDPNLDIAVAINPLVNKAMKMVFKHLRNKVYKETPGMTDSRARLQAEFTLARTMESWCTRRSFMIEIQVCEAVSETVCTVCGEEKCDHLQTLLADGKAPEVLDALICEAHNAE